MDTNHVYLFGSIYKKIELKTSKNGNHYAWFSVSIGVKKNDETKYHNEWYDVTCFGKVAEKLAELSVGDISQRCAISGHLAISVSPKDEKKIRHISVIADDIIVEPPYDAKKGVVRAASVNDIPSDIASAEDDVAF